MPELSPNNGRNTHERLKKEYLLKEDEYILRERDPRRAPTIKQKKTIWDKSKTNEYFHENIFRKDMLGNVCILKPLLNKFKNDENRIFDYEFEHIISHCLGGRTNEENLAILNTDINRDKRAKPLYTHTLLELKGMCYNTLTF